jgi:hypothetical protein
MSVTHLAMIFAKAAAGAAPAGDPPSGDPSLIFSELDFYDKIVLGWTNGDSDAYTRVYQEGTKVAFTHTAGSE